MRERIEKIHPDTSVQAKPYTSWISPLKEVRLSSDLSSFLCVWYEGLLSWNLNTISPYNFDNFLFLFLIMTKDFKIIFKTKLLRKQRWNSQSY
jgi:hypothetical protein